MSPASKSERWSIRRWFGVICAITIGQAAVIALGSLRALPPSRPESGQTRFHFADRGNPPARLAADPTLFALSSRRGFSGPAWRDLTLYKHALNDWEEPPRWLPPEAAGFGIAFQRFADVSGIGAMRIEDKPPPRANLPPAGNLTVANRSSVSPGRELGGRAMLDPVELKSWPSSEVLANTVVQIVVNATGGVLSARLLESSGLRAADEYALEIAATARFAPVAGDQRERANPWAHLTTSALRFHWQTLEPATNPAASNPPQ